jgi:predicted AlkP superfamily pyrophosphatase or phosphodiesterase
MTIELRSPRLHARALTIFLVALLAACTGEAQPPQGGDTSPSATASSSPTQAGPLSRFARIACSLPPEEIQRVWNGYHPTRSGEIQYIPEEPNFVGNFSSHSGPWDYLQEVPLFLYGPGHVPEVGRVGGPATVADLAPTFGQYLDFEFDAVDGNVLTEAHADQGDPPKLILTVVWDGGGRDVLDEYPRAWPTLRRSIPRGVWYDDAIVGSSPSVTPAIHSSIGTGSFPRHHGIVDLRFRVEGRVDPSAFERATLLLGPSLADEYDAANGNRPVVGMVGAEGTLGMIGHGSLFEGGDRDIAAGQRAGEWGLASNNNEFYEFPSYVPELPGYDEVRPNADRQDGAMDGTWYTLDLGPADALTYTPAYSEYQTGVVEEIIGREGFGQDDVTDLLYVNYKQIDKVGHKFSFPSTQMESAVQGVDAALAELYGILDREVGEGEWVLALTADHGSTPRPDTTGAIIIDNFELERDLLAEFDGDGDDQPVVQSPRVTQTWVNLEELEEHGHTLEDMARYLMGYTRADNAADPSTVPAGEGGTRLFAAAFPGEVLEGLPCVRSEG